MDYGYGYGHQGEGLALLFAFLLGTAVILTVLFFAVVAYVVTAIFLSKLLKNAGHRTPVAAWVPFWNSVALMEIAGIRQPWIWTGILVGASILAQLPVVGSILAIVVVILAVILMVYIARGVQSALGISSTGGIVLSVFFPTIWIIWMAVVSKRESYDQDRAIEEGSKLPMNWFGESDVYAPFDRTPVTPPAPSYSYGTSAGSAQTAPAPAAPPVPPVPASQIAEDRDVAYPLPQTPPVPRFGSVPPAPPAPAEAEKRDSSSER